MANEITINQEKDIVYSSFTLHKNGLSAIGDPTFDQWEEVGKFIRKAEGAVHFWIGDWLNYGEKVYGEKYTQAIDQTGFDYQTIANDKYIAKSVEFSRRRENVPFGIHAEIAAFNPVEQEKLLQQAVDTKMTISQLRKEKHKLLLEDKRPLTTIDANLLLGDAIEELTKLPDDTIDCLITDPPYGIDYQSNHRTATPAFDKLENDQDTANDLLDKVLAISQNKLKINSHIYVFCSWKNFSDFESVIKKYFDIKNVLIWDKLNHGTGDLEGNYGERYEMIIFASKGRRLLNGLRPINILPFSRVGNMVHPTEKPISLLEFLIEKSTQEGEVVLDPFMGSGTTCKAAKNTKRNYIGIELDEQWYIEAQRRLSE